MTSHTITPNRINLVIDAKLAQILAFFRAKNPLLKDVDIIRMAIGQTYITEIEKLPVHTLTEEEEKSLLASLAEPRSTKSYSNIDKMMEDILSEKI